jgi:serine/threonine protein kinase
MLPVELAAEYHYVNSLPTRDATYSTMILQHRASGELAELRLYKPRTAPDPCAMLLRTLVDPAYVLRVDRFHYKTDSAFGARDGEEYSAWSITEFCQQGSLGDMVRNIGGKAGKNLLRLFLKESADAIDYLHNLGSGIAHLSISPETIMVRSEKPLRIVFADMGLSKAQVLGGLYSSARGAWHYIAPEVYTRNPSAASDWFALGAVVYELYTGEKLFDAAEGSEVSAYAVRDHCLRHEWSTEAVEDARWKSLIDGLLTWRADKRWSSAQLRDWLSGGSPAVDDDPEEYQAIQRAIAKKPSLRYRPSWGSKLIHDTQELSEQIRLHWDDAAAAFSAGTDDKTIELLQQQSFMDEALQLVSSRKADGRSMVRLRQLLDPKGRIAYKEVVLEPAVIIEWIRTRTADDNKADDNKLHSWITGLGDEGILTLYAELTDAQWAAHTAYLMEYWQRQTEDEALGLSGACRESVQAAYREALPELLTRAIELASGQQGAAPLEFIEKSRELAAMDCSALPETAKLARKVQSATDSDCGLMLLAFALPQHGQEERTELERLEAERIRLETEREAARKADEERKRLEEERIRAEEERRQLEEEQRRREAELERQKEEERQRQEEHHYLSRCQKVDEDTISGHGLFVCREVIETKAYNIDFDNIVWEHSSLRKWLNSEYYDSLPKRVRERVLNKKVLNAANPNNDTEGGNPTYDRVFILSIDEARKYFETDKDRTAKLDKSEWAWWLRSPGLGQRCASYVTRAGAINTIGSLVDYGNYGVRPALWLDLRTDQDEA